MARFWKLEDVEEAAARNPDTFFIPSLEERKTQQVGDDVRLHFLVRDRQEDEPSGERMWVSITRTCGFLKPYRGILTNQPVCIEDINQGDEIEFRPRHIARTIIKRGDPRWIDCFGERALVSEMCFLEGECIRFMYREETDKPEDSGWRMLSGKETDEYLDDASNIRLPEAGWMLDRDPSLLVPLRAGSGAFERPSQADDWQVVTDWEPEE